MFAGRGPRHSASQGRHRVTDGQMKLVDGARTAKSVPSVNSHRTGAGEPYRYRICVVFTLSTHGQQRGGTAGSITAASGSPFHIALQSAGGN